MNFKPAICPNCGGKLQVPDNLTTVKCMYCGVDVIVQNAIKLSGRVKEFTQATDLYIEANPNSKLGSYIFVFVLFVLSLLVSVFVGAKTQSFGIGLGLLLILTFVLYLITIRFEKSAQKQIEESKNTKHLIGYEGECPYCQSQIKLKALSGDNCPACQKRIVIRDSKFYSVDTPISGVNG